jgi:Sec-independent protein translocase protein TatA
VIANLFGTDLGIVVIIAVVVLIAGSQLPKIARNAGLAGKEFRKAQQHDDDYAAAPEGNERTDPSAPAAVPPPSVMSDRTVPAPGSGEPSIQLSPAQLDALLKAREEQTRRQG